MTDLNRKVRRTVRHPQRPLVLTVEPGRSKDDASTAYLEVRELGRRSGYTIELQALYYILADREAANRLAARRARRRIGKLEVAR